MRIALVLLVCLTLGCSLQIGPQGFNGNFGQSSISTCGSIEADGQPDCTVIQGAPISVPGAQLVGGWLAMVTGAVAKFFGVSVPVPAGGEGT